MKPYELTCLISPELSEEEIITLQDKITSFITRASAKGEDERSSSITRASAKGEDERSSSTTQAQREVEKNESSSTRQEEGVLNSSTSPIKKSLGSSVKGKLSAYLITLNFQLNPERLVGFEKKLKAEEQILRYLLSIKPPVKKAVFLKKKLPKTKPLEKGRKHEVKVELKEIEKKLEEILEDEPK